MLVWQSFELTRFSDYFFIRYTIQIYINIDAICTHTDLTASIQDGPFVAGTSDASSVSEATKTMSKDRGSSARDQIDLPFVLAKATETFKILLSATNGAPLCIDGRRVTKERMRHRRREKPRAKERDIEQHRSVYLTYRIFY